MSCCNKKEKRSSAILKNRAKFGRSVQYEALILITGRNIYAQIVDFNAGKTVCAVSTVKNGNKVNNRNIKNATILGAELAKKCQELGIKNVSFNRADKKFCGVLNGLAEEFYKGIA